MGKFLCAKWYMHYKGKVLSLVLRLNSLELFPLSLLAHPGVSLWYDLHGAVIPGLATTDEVLAKPHVHECLRHAQERHHRHVRAIY